MRAWLYPVFATCAAVTAQEPAPEPPAAPMTTIQYRGIRATDPQAGTGLRNPERGWRNEIMINWGLPSRYAVPVVGEGEATPDWWLAEIERYRPFGMTLLQFYYYLDRWEDSAIPPEGLAHLDAQLAKVRAAGCKVILRFAYEKDIKGPAGATCERILGHLEQLAPAIRRNADIIAVMQAGFVGAWGEWHSSKHGLQEDHEALSRIMAKILDVLPADRMTQVRVPKYKRWCLEGAALKASLPVTAANAHSGLPAARIGFNNDGFLAGKTCGGTWTEPPLFSNPGNPEFDTMTAESPYVMVDGELFYADQAGPVDGLQAMQRLRLHHYTSFSLMHSYSEREGKPFSIDRWLTTALTEEQIVSARLPLSDQYCHDANGNAVARTVFEYIRDHLGYRLELQRAAFPTSAAPGQRLACRLELINRGFAALHNPRPVFLVVVTPDQQVIEQPIADADPRQWQPFAPGDAEFAPLLHTLTAAATLPTTLVPGWYRLGLWLPDASASLRYNPDYSIRLANGDTLWWTDPTQRYGANLIGGFSIAAPAADLKGNP
jgi:hypothetical protein